MEFRTFRSALAIAGAALAFALAAPAPAATFTITVNDSGTCSGTWQTTGTATSPTVTVSSPPPQTTSCSGFSSTYLGDLVFNGTQTESNGMRGATVGYAKITIPNPLPAGWLGKTAQISVFEYADGAFWKKVYLSKTPCDFTPVASAWGQGTGVNIYVTFGGGGFGSVAVQAGDVWYLNVKNETIFGSGSCGSGLSCNFAVRVYPPN